MVNKSGIMQCDAR